MKSYETARNLFSFLGFCAGALIVLGVIVALMGGSATQSFGRNSGATQFIIGAMPGILMAAVGVFGQAMVQMGRASVDTAEFSQQSLNVSRQHMELSKQLLEQGRTAAASFASLTAQRPVPTTSSHASGPEQGASYSNQSSQNTSVGTHDGRSAAIAESAAASSKVITREEQIPLAPVRQEIVYQDGMFVVGGKQFGLKREALEYQEALATAPVK